MQFEEAKFPQSGTIQSARYRPSSLELEVIYHDGDRYTYLGVSPDDFETLKSAESAGAFINRVIKKKYKFKNNY